MSNPHSEYDEHILSSEVFDIEPDLRVREELISFHALNPFVVHNSSARSYMCTNHVSQALVPIAGDEKIIQTGLEKQLGANTFSKKALEDVRVLKVISRYNGITANSVSAKTYVLVIVESLTTGEIDFIELPYYFSLHQYFGFKYKWNEELLSNLTPGTILPKNTILADSPAVTKNSGYKFGVNANIALMNLPETAEDGVIISKSGAERYSYYIYETRVMETGSDTFPLNLYGDKDNYKPFPDIGEKVNKDSVIMAMRRYDDDLAPALLSVNDVTEFNPIHDMAVYVKGPGYDTIENGSVVSNGTVVDVRAWKNNKFKREVYTNTTDNIDKYIKGNVKFYNELIDVYEALKKDHYRKTGDNNLKVSEKLHRMLIDAYAVANRKNVKMAYSHKNEPLDIVRVEITIQYKVTPGIGSKISDLAGKV